MFGRLCVDNELRQRNFALKRSSGTSERSTEDGGSERSSSFSSETDHLGEGNIVQLSVLGGAIAGIVPKWNSPLRSLYGVRRAQERGGAHR